MRTSRRSLLALTALLAIGGGAHAQTAYTFTDLGVLNPANPRAFGHDINDNGQVLAVSLATSGYGRAFRVTPATDGNGNPVWFVDANSDGVNDLAAVLPLPSGYVSSTANPGSGINASGQATLMIAAATTPQTAAVWNAAGTSVTALTATTVSSYPNGINDGGDVAGWLHEYKKQKPPIPVLWQFSAGSYTMVRLSSSQGRALKVNNARQVVGYLGVGGDPTDQAFLWLPSAAYGLPQGLNLLSGITLSDNKGSINQAGIIAGTVAGNTSRLALRVPPGGAYGLSAGVNDLGSGGWTSVAPWGLNNPLSGQPLLVVGQALSGTSPRAFVWDSASQVFQDLNAVTVNLPAGWTLTRAEAVNNRGQIVGRGTYNGATRAFVLTPTP